MISIIQTIFCSSFIIGSMRSMRSIGSISSIRMINSSPATFKATIVVFLYIKHFSRRLLLCRRSRIRRHPWERARPSVRPLHEDRPRRPSVSQRGDRKFRKNRFQALAREALSTEGNFHAVRFL